MKTKLSQFKKINENNNSDYIRVIPRDLFNESKLLKCMGRLCVLIHDNDTPFEMNVEHNDEPFNIALTDDGSLTITNINISINDIYFNFYTTYNSKDNYPLFCGYENDEVLVFDESGKFTNDFIDFVKNIINVE